MIGEAHKTHSDNLQSLQGWDDITHPLLEKLGTPQTYTDALSVIHQLQRLSVIAALGFGHYQELHQIFKDCSLPLWKDYATLQTSEALKQRLGDLLYEGDPKKITPLIVNLCDYGRGVGERIIERCMQDNLDVEVTFDDPWYHRTLMQILSAHDVEAYALWRAGRTGEVERRIGMRVTHNSIAIPIHTEESKEKAKLYNDIVTDARRHRETNPFFTITVLPVPEDAVLDQITYEEYLELFFRMCDVDWDKIDKAHHILIERLNRANILRFTNNDGTDLTMDVTGFTFANSLVSKNVPGSEVFSAPHKTSVNGKIVAKGRFVPKDDKELVEDIVLEFKDGRVISYDAAVGLEILQKQIETDEGSCYVGEIGIGTNPALRKHVVNSLMVEKIGGSFHVALGRAYSFDEYLGVPVKVDNGNRSKIHWDITTMLIGKQGRIYADGEVIMEDGYFLDPHLSALNGV
jgi:aminopeptidase